MESRGRNMRYLLKNNQFFQNIKILNQMILPTITEPLQIEFVYLNCIPQNGTSETVHNFPHVHTYFEFHFPINHDVYYAFENATETVLSNQFIVIQPNVEHTIMDIDPSLVKFGLGIMFSNPILNEYTSELKNALSHHNYSIGTQTGKMKLCFENILRECQDPNFFSPYAIRDHLIQLLLEIAVSLNKNTTQLYKYADSFQDHRIGMIKQFISDNLNKPLDTANVATYMHISIKQLNRIFYKSEGVSVSRYIAATKCSQAVKLLTTTELLIKEIAFLLGFDNEKSFGAFFKKLYKMSPSKFRKSYRHYASPIGDSDASEEENKPKT